MFINKKFLGYFKIIVLFSLIVILGFNIIGCSGMVEPDELENGEGPTKVEKFTKGNKADVLMLCYMDGDNDLSLNIWQDLNEMEYGLYLASDKGKNSAKVDILALWDGKGYGDTHLYKIGSDNRLIGTGNGKSVHTGLSENTLDITSAAASWIYNSTDEQYEVTMSNPDTLKSFLNWVNQYYDIDSNTKIILQFANHGKGPRSRAMCEDENKVGSNNPQFLFTKDIPKAIREAGIISGVGAGKKTKIDIVIHDICNGASIEEAYEYKDVADYMLFSPNRMPGSGLNYSNVVSHLKEGDCINSGILNSKSFLDKTVYDFIDEYKKSDKFWRDYKGELKKSNNEAVNDDFAVSVSYKEAATITAVELSGIKKVQENIQTLAGLLIDSNNEFTNKNSSGEIVLPSSEPYLYYLFNLVFKDIYYYKTHYARLYDIGILLNKIIDFNAMNNVAAGKNAIKDAANILKSSLNNVILYSWRDGVGGALYNKSSNTKLKGISPCDSGAYGLVISGIGYDYNNDGKPVSLKFPYVEGTDSFDYNSSLQFGAATDNWKQLMDGMIEALRINK